MYFYLSSVLAWWQSGTHYYWDCRSSGQLSTCKVVGCHRSKTGFAFLFCCFQMASLSSLRNVVSQHFLSGVFQISSLDGRDSGEWGKSKLKDNLFIICMLAAFLSRHQHSYSLFYARLMKMPERVVTNLQCNITKNSVSHTQTLRCVWTRDTICTFLALDMVKHKNIENLAGDAA